MINFTICGIWHGANWTYVLFGFLNGCYFIPLILRGTLNKKKKITKGKLLPSPTEFINMVATFILVMFTLVIFRSETVGQAFQYFGSMFSRSLFTLPALSIFDIHQTKVLIITFFIMLMIIFEWLQREKDYGLQIGNVKSALLRWGIYYMLIVLILVFIDKQETFIYLQF